MTEKQPRVAIIEDNPDWVDSAKDILEMLGCAVVGIARSMQEATDLVSRLDAEGADFVLLDGNLGESFSGDDGEDLAYLIRQKSKQVKIVGFSAGRQEYVDIKLGKLGFDRKKLKAIFFPEEQIFVRTFYKYYQQNAIGVIF